MIKHRRVIAWHVLRPFVVLAILLAIALLVRGGCGSGPRGL